MPPSLRRESVVPAGMSGDLFVSTGNVNTVGRGLAVEIEHSNAECRKILHKIKLKITNLG